MELNTWKRRADWAGLCAKPHSTDPQSYHVRSGVKNLSVARIGKAQFQVRKKYHGCYWPYLMRVFFRHQLGDWFVVLGKWSIVVSEWEEGVVTWCGWVDWGGGKKARGKILEVARAPLKFNRGVFYSLSLCSVGNVLASSGGGSWQFRMVSSKLGSRYISGEYIHQSCIEVKSWVAILNQVQLIWAKTELWNLTKLWVNFDATQVKFKGRGVSFYKKRRILQYRSRPENRKKS